MKWSGPPLKLPYRIMLIDLIPLSYWPKITGRPPEDVPCAQYERAHWPHLVFTFKDYRGMSSTVHPRRGSGVTSGEGQFERGISLARANSVLENENVPDFN